MSSRLEHLTPSSSAPGTSPLSAPQPQPLSPAGSQNRSRSKRTRPRPTKACEECRRKKLKCDRERPCSHCRKGGQDGSSCVFRVVLDEGQSGGIDQVQESPVDRYSNVPKFARTDPIGPGRGILAYGLTDFAAPARVQDREWRSEVPTSSPVAMAGRSELDNRNGNGNGNRPVNGILAHGATCYADAKASTKNWVDVESTPTSWGSVKNESARALGRLHVKGTRSRYVGIADKMAMLDHFEDSKKFIVGSIKDPETSDMFRELSVYHNVFQTNNKPDQVIPNDRNDRKELMAEMIKALPSSLLFGILQAKYVSNWETIWRVLHIGTFVKDCNQIIKIRDSGSLGLPPHIRDSVVPQILAVLSTASRLHDPDDRGAATERLSDEQISRNCQLVQAWLDGLHGKALVDLHTLRTRTLLLIARQANLATPSELWLGSGKIVRSAMVMGLHQDPEPWDEISKFDKEMRRKLWMTIVELDIQFSFDAGMPSALTSNSFNVRELLNVDDHDLTEDMAEYPLSKPLTVWTHALPQIALSASLKARLETVNTLGGNVNLSESAPTLLQQALTLENALLSLPPLFRSSTRAGNTSNERLYRLFTSVILDVFLRRPLMTLYRTISLSSLSPRYPEVRKGALRSALAILSHLDALDPSVADLNIVKSREYLNVFHILRESDILQAALILCYEIKCYNSPSSENLDPSLHDEGPVPQAQYSLTRVVENTLNSLLARLGEFGSDLKDVLMVSVALQAVKGEGEVWERRELMIRGAERVLRACRKVRPDIITVQGYAESSQNGNHNAGRTRDQQQGEGYDGYDGLNMMTDDGMSFDTLDFGFLDWWTS